MHAIEVGIRVHGSPSALSRWSHPKCFGAEGTQQQASRPTVVLLREHATYLGYRRFLDGCGRQKDSVTRVPLRVLHSFPVPGTPDSGIPPCSSHHFKFGTDLGDLFLVILSPQRLVCASPPTKLGVLILKMGLRLIQLRRAVVIISFFTYNSSSVPWRNRPASGVLCMYFRFLLLH